MEKFLKPHDKECMRLAMIKHEETFKEQVYELHRLYRIQKVMMRNIESNKLKAQIQELWSSNYGCKFNQTNQAHDINQHSIKFDLERPAEEYDAESNGDRRLVLIDESEIELTLGPTSYNLKKKKTETPLTSDSGPSSVSSSSTGSSHIKRTNSMTHQMKEARRKDLSLCELGLVGQFPDMSLRYQSGRRNSNDVQEQLRQKKLKQTPWFSQVLSMNMT